MPAIPYIPATAPFTPEQRAWLNGFLAGLMANADSSTPQPVPDAPPASAQPLLILFGSQTGSAEGLARGIAREAGQRKFAPRVMPLNDCKPATLAEAGQVVIISSTWGDGDPPDNAVTFWSWLNTSAAPRLESLQFAVLGLGDRNYADFCGAAKKFDARLEALGGRRVAPRGECDVDYEATAKGWVEQLWGKLEHGSGSAPLSNGRAALAIKTNGQGSFDLPHIQKSPGQQPFSNANPFPTGLLKSGRLSKPGSSKEVWHHEICLRGSGLVYEPGDALGVVPINCPEVAAELLAALRCSGEEVVKFGPNELPLCDALSKRLEITKPSTLLLQAVAERVPDCEFAPLLAPERAADLKQWSRGREVLDVVRLLPEPPKPAELVTWLRKLSPRLYSLASSQRAHPEEAHLTVGAVRYESHGRARKGVASTFLADRIGATDRPQVFVQKSPGFKLPADGDRSIIMVGPGTGIAPFRAFLEDRQATGARGKNWLLFGDQKQATDFLYEEQITGWAKAGHLARLDLAFSRDQPQKIYVQNRMLEKAGVVWSWLEDGAHFYVCGDAARMAADVDAALHQIVETAGGKSQDEAKNYVAKLRSERRYQRDVY